MSSQRKDKAGTDSESMEKNGSLTDDGAQALLSICQEYHKQNDVDTHFNWSEIAEKRGKEFGKKLASVIAKNKFDYMKKTWVLWSKLRMDETGLGWDVGLGMIRASDDWWTKKIKEDKKYRRFKNSPPDPEMSELWDIVYDIIIATGQHCVSTSMDSMPPPILLISQSAPISVRSNEVRGISSWDE